MISNDLLPRNYVHGTLKEIRPAYPKFPICVLQWPKLCTFPQNGVLSKFCLHTWETVITDFDQMRTHIWKHWKQSQSTIFLIHLSQNHNVTPCKNQCILAYIIEAKLCCLLVTYCTGLIQVLIFNKMQIPCNGHVCFLLNNVRCCGRHIHAHNQFRDHHFSPTAPVSEYFKVPGTPC